ncbi:MAG: type IV secretory system conjugative DNA transfer family protein [Candidatus Methanoperedens sp.]
MFFNRILAYFHANKQLHIARFARLDELESLVSSEHDESGLLLGKAHFNQILRISQTLKRRELGNLLIVAPTRGGKGLLAVSQLLTWKHSVIVNDIKGDLFLQTAGYRSSLGEVIVIDPQGYGHRFDPLDGKMTEDELHSAATHLLFQADEGEGKIFTLRAITMLTQLFLAARSEGQPPFPYVRKTIRKGLRSAAERLNIIKPELATKFLDVKYDDANFEDRFLLSAWGTLTARIEPLLTETVICSLAGSDFSPKELMFSEKPITVYLRWTERDLLALSPLVRLLWGSLIDELITTYDKTQGNKCKPALLLIDEAGRTAIPSLADHATTVVGRGITLWIAIQSLFQLEAEYGRARANILRDNMETQIYYRPANQATAEYLERCLGKKSEYAYSHTMREGTETSKGFSEQGIPLMTAWEIKQLRDEEIIGFHRNFLPFKAKRMDWRNSKLLKQRQQIPAPELLPLPQISDKLHNITTKRGDIFISEYVDPDRRRNTKKRND